MGDKEKINIVVKEVVGEVHFSGGVNQESMMSLIDKLIELENKIQIKYKYNGFK